MRTIFVLIDENRHVVGWGTTRSMDTEIEINIEEDNPFLRDNPRFYKLQEDNTIVKDEQAYSNYLESKEKQNLAPTNEERIAELENALFMLMMKGV